MKRLNTEIEREIIINTIKAMSEEQLEKFVEDSRLDFRKWYRVKINGKEVPWWACEFELDDVKKRYVNVEFEPISYCETWVV